MMNEANKSHLQILDMCQKLARFGELEGTELGEYWIRLAELYECSSSMLDSDFEKMVINQIEEQSKYIDEHCMIVVETETIHRSYKRIEWV